MYSSGDRVTAIYALVAGRATTHIVLVTRLSHQCKMSWQAISWLGVAWTHHALGCPMSCHAALFSGSEGQVRSPPRLSRLRTSVGAREMVPVPWSLSTGQCHSHGAPRLHCKVRSSLALPHMESPGRGVLWTAQYYGAPCDTHNFRLEEHLRVGAVNGTVSFFFSADLGFTGC